MFKTSLEKRIYVREYRQRNLERCREWGRRYQRENADKVREYQRAYRAAHRPRIRLLYQAKKYGLTVDELVFLKEMQDYRCALCKKKKKLSVDHNHTTGRVRGLLCYSCNTLLGQANDNQDKLRAAIAYLDNYELR